MDYADGVETMRHADFDAYLTATPTNRRVLLTTSGDTALQNFVFRKHDHLMFGNEGKGAPPRAHDVAAARLRIPASGRSLNLSASVAIALWEALRQTRGLHTFAT